MMRLIAAIDQRRGMAANGGIPWDLPTDRDFFAEQTATGVIVMGYTTYTEIEEPLHGRVNYVASRRDRSMRPGFQHVADLLAFVNEQEPGTVIQNIGGAALFTSTIALADELVLTRIDGDFECDRFFPPFEAQFTQITESEPITENGSTFTFQTWTRRPE